MLVAPFFKELKINLFIYRRKRSSVIPKKRTYKIPLTIKGIFTIFILILIPLYWIWYGPGNFLWTSDIALFFVFLATLFESRLLASMVIVGNLLYETYWNIDFFLLLLHLPSSGMTDYMLNSANPLWLRSLSLFHVALPPLMIWLVYKLGYNRKAWLYQIIFATALLFLTWLVTNPDKNINLVYGYQQYTWLEMNTFLYLVLLAIANAVLIFLTHLGILFFKSKHK